MALRVASPAARRCLTRLPAHRKNDDWQVPPWHRPRALRCRETAHLQSRRKVRPANRQNGSSRRHRPGHTARRMPPAHPDPYKGEREQNPTPADTTREGVAPSSQPPPEAPTREDITSRSSKRKATHPTGHTSTRSPTPHLKSASPPTLLLAPPPDGQRTGVQPTSTS